MVRPVREIKVPPPRPTDPKNKVVKCRWCNLTQTYDDGHCNNCNAFLEIK